MDKSLTLKTIVITVVSLIASMAVLYLATLILSMDDTEMPGVYHNMGYPLGFLLLICSLGSLAGPVLLGYSYFFRGFEKTNSGYRLGYDWFGNLLRGNEITDDFCGYYLATMMSIAQVLGALLITIVLVVSVAYEYYVALQSLIVLILSITCIVLPVLFLKEFVSARFADWTQNNSTLSRVDKHIVQPIGRISQRVVKFRSKHCVAVW